MFSEINNYLVAQNYIGVSYVALKAVLCVIILNSFYKSIFRILLALTTYWFLDVKEALEEYSAMMWNHLKDDVVMVSMVLAITTTYFL
jgi:hypothetical protein